MTPTPPPASPAAVERGCVCPRSTNHDGRGARDPETGRVYWLADGDCPLHGYGTPAPHKMDP